jgi:hypothetical protein
MKVKITQRNVYHKIAQIEIDVPVPKDAFFETIHEWIMENEDEWVDKIDHELNEQEFVSGNGMNDDRSWTDCHEVFECRIDAVRETKLGKMPTGGHL